MGGPVGASWSRKDGRRVGMGGITVAAILMLEGRRVPVWVGGFASSVVCLVTVSQGGGSLAPWVSANLTITLVPADIAKSDDSDVVRPLLSLLSPIQITLTWSISSITIPSVE